MKVASWNVNSLKVRLGQLVDWLEQEPLDVIGLQETKLPDENFPKDEIEAAGYQVAFTGQRTYNGVALLSRHAVTDLATNLPGMEDDPQRRFITATCKGVRIYNLYVPNGQAVGSDKFAYKMQWLSCLRDELERALCTHKKVLVMGDFNIAPADADVHDPREWEGKIHCSNEERDALGRLFELGLCDSFRLFEQEPGLYSWWDYRMAAFRRNRGLRIDLILANQPMADQCIGSYIDREPRAAERPSDHAPVVAEFDL